jgi:glycosyltransferase involved in cell wall biosynthesis
MPNSSKPKPNFVVVHPGRSVCDTQEIVLSQLGLLRYDLSGQRTPNLAIPGNQRRLCTFFGIWTKATRKLTSLDRWEWLRSAAHPAFDLWARSYMKPGDNVISSYGYANLCFRYARKTGGKTFIDAGNSHPEQFWEIVGNEHKKWGIDRLPIPRHWNERGRRMLDFTDYILSPSSYVTESFTKRGWPTERIFYLPYPVDLRVFSASSDAEITRNDKSPLRVICTGSVSVRKGFPYLLEAMRIIRRDREAVLMLTDVVESSMKEILPKYADIPIEWSPPLPHKELAERLKQADVFALLSLEDGFARTVTEALACGLPTVVAQNTGALDFIRPGINGEIVPICDAAAAAEAILKCAARPKSSPKEAHDLLEELSFVKFRERFVGILQKLEMIAN